ncbi:MAG: SGNH/GDSL hydrolase family protein [Acidimicrobiia bacterium]
MIEDRSPPRMPAGQVIGVTLVALVVGLILNAPDIRRTADRQEAGWKRDVAVVMIEPFEWFSRTFRFEIPHRLIDSALGRSDPITIEAPVSTTTTSQNREVVAAVTTTTAAPSRRQISASEPLRMFIGGDSMVGQFGPMLQNRAEEGGLVEVTEVLYEFSSGLTRPDFLDWPVRLRQIRETQDPDVIVLFFGGNDAQAIQIDGTWHEFGSERWLAEYRRRVGDLMAELDRDGRDVYWMGMPIVRSNDFREKIEVLNEIYESESDRFGRVTYVDSWSVFTGGDGGFSEYLTDSAGNLVDMRLNDGIHLTTAGGIRLAEVVFNVIAQDWGVA